MNLRWYVRKVPKVPSPYFPQVWRVWDSLGHWDSDYDDWASAVDWAASPSKRIQYYANGGVR